MSSARNHRGIVVALAVSLLLALPALAQAGPLPASRLALQASSWDGFLDVLRWTGLGGWLNLGAWRGAVSSPKDVAAAPAGSQSAANGAGTGLDQHGTIDPNGG